jgi:drug/metabolite transporter (DMT)-like permease
MTGWLAAMVLLAVAAREAGQLLHVFQIMELRSLLGIALFAPMIIAAGGVRAMRTRHFGSHFSRNAVHYVAQFLWFVAIMMIPIAEVVAIEFTGPVWVALLAVVALGERMTAARVAAVVLGVVGVVIIVRPGLDHVDVGQVVALLAAIGFAGSIILVKSLTRTESVVSIIFWMLIIQSVIGAIPAAIVWQTPPMAAWPWLAVIAVCGTYSHFCMAHALRHADATTVVPLDFLRVPLTAVAAWLVFAERFDIFTIIGAAVILGGNLLNLKRSASPLPVQKQPDASVSPPPSTAAAGRQRSGPGPAAPPGAAPAASASRSPPRSTAQRSRRGS